MKKRHFTQAHKLSLVALAVAVFSQPALAIDYVWQGGDGQWLDAGKWTLLGVPGSGDTATINNTGTGSIILNTTRSIDRLTMNGGSLGGAGILNTDRLDFNGGNLGATAFGLGGTVNVAGSTFFNGASNQGVMWSQTLNLNGNSTWSAGNGRLVVDSAYSAGNSSYPSAVLHIASGTTFTDLGAASSSGYKLLGGGNANVVNDGTYTRSGLGTTWVRGLNNAGTLNVSAGTLGFDTGWLNTSSGQVNVAQGAELLLAATTFTGGSVNNAGKITVIGYDSEVQAAASISGNWQINAGRLFVEGSQRIGTLVLNGGTLSGQGALTVDALSFNAGSLTNRSFQTGNQLIVKGDSNFAGTANLSIGNSAQLQLQGNSTWSAGNGRLSVDSAYSAGNSRYPSAVLHIGSGTTFTDLGAASSTGYKLLGGGTVSNDGTMLRTGLGSTEVRGLVNHGLVDVAEGTLLVNASFSNFGTLTVRSGAVLQGLSGAIRNDGVFSGDGTVRTVSLTNALVNAGTLTPGGLGTAGSLLLDGDLTQSATGQLRIDLDAGQHDLLTVTSDISFAGTLQIWAAPGLALHLGDSFVVATYGKRLATSTFADVQWLGSGANPFSVEYGATALTLRVTSAVPEPTSAALWLLGAAALLTRRARRLPRATQE